MSLYAQVPELREKILSGVDLAETASELLATCFGENSELKQDMLRYCTTVHWVRWVVHVCGFTTVWVGLYMCVGLPLSGLVVCGFTTVLVWLCVDFLLLDIYAYDGSFVFIMTMTRLASVYDGDQFADVLEEPVCAAIGGNTCFFLLFSLLLCWLCRFVVLAHTSFPPLVFFVALFAFCRFGCPSHTSLLSE